MGRLRSSVTTRGWADECCGPDLALWDRLILGDVVTLNAPPARLARRPRACS